MNSLPLMFERQNGYNVERPIGERKELANWSAKRPAS